MESRAIDLAVALSKFTDHWSPKRIATLNDYDIKVVKVQGSFVWHKHNHTDELFLVLSGALTIQFHPKDRGNVMLKEGQLFVIPKGLEHCPMTENGEEASILVIEPVGVVNTGDAAGSTLTNAVVDI